jgi:MFS family permease
MAFAGIRSSLTLLRNGSQLGERSVACTSVRHSLRLDYHARAASRSERDPVNGATDPVTPAQMRATFAVCTVVGLSLLVATGLTFLVAPVAMDLGLSDEVIEDALVVPAIAALMVVFVSGYAGDVIGHRRTMIIAGLIFASGAALLAMASNGLSVQMGLAVAGIGAALIQVVAVALLQNTAPRGSAHISAFTSLGLVYPLAFLVLPVATAGLVVLTDWRWVPCAWVLAGLLISGIAWRVLDRAAPTASRGEWGTPLLAGLSLAAGCTALAEVDNLALEPVKIACAAALCAAAAVACFARGRRAREPGFSMKPINGALSKSLLLGVAAISCIQLLTYLSIAMEYFYDLTALQVAIAIVPAQIGAIVGAKVVAQVAIRHLGTGRAGRVLVLLTGASTLPLALTVAATPMWLLIVVATIFSTVGFAALTVLNLDVMRRAPANNTGAVSAFRTAASSIGTAAGMALLGTIIITSIDIEAAAGGADADQRERLATALRIDGVLSCVIAVAAWLILTLAVRHSRSGVEVFKGEPQ